MSEKFKIKNINDLLDVFENTDGYYLGDYTCFQIADYIRKMYNQLQQKENIIKEARELLNQEWYSVLRKGTIIKVREILDKENQDDKN